MLINVALSNGSKWVNVNLPINSESGPNAFKSLYWYAGVHSFIDLYLFSLLFPITLLYWVFYNDFVLYRQRSATDK